MTVDVFARGSRASHLLSAPFLFSSPPPAGRRIMAGFSYAQRIGKRAHFDIWSPACFPQGAHARRLPSGELGPVQWAAVREFELLQESGNDKIYDLDAAHIPRALRDLSRMRAGGYRITVVTLGAYEAGTLEDELETLDLTLQERIAQMIHMLYLDLESGNENAKIDRMLDDNAWDYRNALPHVAMLLRSAMMPTQPETIRADMDVQAPRKPSAGHDVTQLVSKNRRAKIFFDILSRLPQSHIVHDTAIGLRLPELNGKNQWNYIASPDQTLAAFNHVLANLFGQKTFHLRGYGDRLTNQSTHFYQGAALALG